MDNDDKPIGTILNRRDVLKVLGLGGTAALLAACAPDIAETPSPTSTIPATAQSLASDSAVVAASTPIPACVVRPELTEGPYFVDEMLNRADIRMEPSDGSIVEGLPLELIFNVSQVGANGCVPLPGAQVDIWHCDVFGVYSDAQDRSFNTIGKKFLRGYQITDSNGIAKFTTIYPGWYNGRTVHIHFKIRINNQDFTSQLFFDDIFTHQVYLQQPYAQTGQRTVLNSQDNIFNESGGVLTLAVQPAGNGYKSTFDIGMQI